VYASCGLEKELPCAVSDSLPSAIDDDGARVDEVERRAMKVSRVEAGRKDDPLGADPRGFFHARGTFVGMPFAQQGEVTCLNVQGNRASVKYRFRRATGATEPFEGGGVQFFVEDNGEPRGGEPVDATTFDPPQPEGVFDAAADACDDPRARVYDRIDSGNLSVRDAAP